MSCYFRHIKDIISETGIEITPANKKRIDQAIHQIANISYKDCPATWKKLKEIIGNEPKRRELIRKLQHAIR